MSYHREELESLIFKYTSLPRSFFVAFALYCVKDARHLLGGLSTSKALDFVQLWLDGKATGEEVKVSPDWPDKDYETFRYLDCNAVYTTYGYAVYGASRAALNAAYDVSTEGYIIDDQILKYKAEFVRMLKALSKVERLIYNIDEKDL